MAIALSVAVMIITMAVVTGFQKEIRDKVAGFGAHIIVTINTSESTYETAPIDKRQSFLTEIKKLQGVHHVQPYAVKAGIIKTKEDMQGIVVKGIDTDFDWDFFRKNMVQGKPFELNDSVKSDKIILSKTLASLLKLKLGDTVAVFFVQENKQRARRPVIAGIYETGLGEQFDKVFALMDIRQVQTLNGWSPGQVSGFEILVNDFKKVDEINAKVNEVTGAEFLSRTIRQNNAQVFYWLDAQDVNAVVVISLMLIVAAINMITTLLILILERTNMIGILKALGTSNASVRKIFIWNAAYLTGWGLLIGNFIAITLCLLQQKFGFAPLDPASYYLTQVPVHLDWLSIALLDAGTFGICILFLLIPSFVISRIDPIKVIRFE